MTHRAFVSLMVGLALIVAGVLYLNVTSKLDSRQGCERSKVSNGQQAKAYSAILSGFKRTDQQVPGEVTPDRRRAERDLEMVIMGARARSRLDCRVLYPIVGSIR